MELIQRNPLTRNFYNVVSGNSTQPWYRNKCIMWIAAAVVILIVGLALLLGNILPSFTADKGPSYSEDQIISEKSSNSKEFQILPPIIWDGVCPKRASKCPSSFQGIPPVVLVSLDGFRPDYLERGFTPTIKNIAECGTKAPFMYPVFPTKTFPNHFSQVTGLNPASHGIIDNQMYDPKKGKRFKVGQTDILESFWWQKDPIWVTAIKQGKKAACYFWPGSEAKINDTYPNFYQKYSSKTPFNARVDQVLKWLDLPIESRPHFITLYVNEPDHAAHDFGVNAKEVNQALKKVDNMISRLFSGLQIRNITECVNIIIVSDHGMSDIDCNHVVDIQHFINVSSTYYVTGPFGRLRPKGYFNRTKINEMVSSLQCQSQHMRAYAKEQLPVRMHFADNQRIEAIFLDMDAGWTVVNKDVKTEKGICTGGAHGYDNLFPDMRAIFIAHGPSFKKSYTSESFINTELYEMLCELIDIIPNPNNGTKGSLHDILTTPHKLPAQKEPDSPTVAEVPKDEIEYTLRINAANCSGTQSSKKPEIKNQAEKKTLHTPFGVPFDVENNDALRLLFNEDYVSAFDINYHLPMWSSFTITGLKDVSNEDIIWKGDGRIKAQGTSHCGDYNSTPVRKLNVLQRPLYPPNFSDISTEDQAKFVTNSIPKSLNHSNILEKEMNKILSQKASETNQLNIVMGPAFDLDFTGIKPSAKSIMKYQEKTRPLLVPTHVFIITTWCSDKSIELKECEASKLKVLSYLLPNHPYSQNCEPADKVILKNVARVVDIENLTGITFFTGLPIYDAIRLRTSMPDI